MPSAEIGHDSLVDLASEKTFQAPDDLPFGSAVRRAAYDVINGRLMVPHADDDSSLEGGVGVAVAAPIEPVPTGGHPGRGRERTRAAELREGGFRTNPVGIVAEDDQQFGRGVGVPWGGGIGKIFAIGSQPVNGQVQAFWNAVHPEPTGEPPVGGLPPAASEGASWTLRFQLQFLFPR